MGVNKMKRIALILFLIAGTAGLVNYLSGCGKRPASGVDNPVAYWVDPMNPAHTYDKPGKAPCGMDLVPMYAGDKSVKGIRIDPNVVQNIGVTTEDVQERNLQKEIRTSGTVGLNEPKVYTVSSKIAGWADKLYVSFTGEQVVKGQPLLEIYSPDLVSTQEEYLQSLRYAQSLAPDASAEARRGAQQLVDSTRARLLNWDIPDSEIRTLEARGTATKTMTLRSPDNGVVLEKMVEQGKQVEPGMVLYRIADLSTVWVLADIYQQDFPFVKLGDHAAVTLSSWPGKAFDGRVAFISPVVNPDAKTAQARIEVRNTPDGNLKPGMFATVQILAPVAVKAVAIPEQAVIHSGERNIAVINLGNGYFDPREVHLGITAGGYVQVLLGVQAGEKVVTSAQFLIDSESNLKSAVQMLGGGQHGGSMPGMNMPETQSPPSENEPLPQSQESQKVPGTENQSSGAEPTEKADHADMNMPGMEAPTPAGVPQACTLTPEPTVVQDNMQNMPGM
jgi:RND family efflux transporter MFP subunit